MMMAPRAADGFTWVPAPWGLTLRAGALAHVVHGWTARPLRLRGDVERERREWAQVADAAGVGPASLVRLHQVHEASVHVAASTHASTPSSPHSPVFPRADIAVSDTPGIAVAVQVADCVPLLIAGPRGLVAAAHAGWRGTAANVAGRAVEALVERGSNVSQLLAAIGPSIGACCYEVGAEVNESFGRAGWSAGQRERWFSTRERSLRLDLWGANRDQLIASGVPAANVHVSGLCTSCHTEWFHSYRRDGAGTGRMAAFIKPPENTI
jgi:polyphenol oxidase